MSAAAAAPAEVVRHPGEILRTDYLAQVSDMNQGELSFRLGVPRTKLNTLINNPSRRITPEMALRLSRFLGTRAEFWMYAQADFDLAQVRADERTMRSINQVRSLVRNLDLFRGQRVARGAAEAGDAPETTGTPRRLGEHVRTRVKPARRTA